LWRIIAPSERLGENPDLLVQLLHGEIDATVPLGSSQSFQQALAAAGYDAQFIPFDEGHKIPHELTLEMIAEVVEKLYAR
jgi:dipeptidyl aminopeptidase/acylaminoacyl peptidase